MERDSDNTGLQCCLEYESNVCDIAVEEYGTDLSMVITLVTIVEPQVH